jgi:uncharacterized membrane protein (UPF0127 family)
MPAARGAQGGSHFVVESKLIVNVTRGKCLCVGELANRPLSRMRGLIGRPGLPAGEGLLISPAPAIHTAFMRFPIDALFLDADLRVLGIVERLRPWRLASNARARSVLELSAGESARCGVQIGDTLELRARAGSATGASRAPDSNGADVVEPQAAPEGNRADVVEPQASPAGEEPAPAVSRMQPLRVLIVSDDRHFRTVMSLLLARRNCSVTATANAARVEDLIARDGAEVVVMDVSRSPGVTRGRKLDAGAQQVGVVLVADEARPPAYVSPVLSKWGPFSDLLEAIEQAHAHSAEREDAREHS